MEPSNLPKDDNSDEEVAAFGATNPFAISARNQARERKRLKTSHFGPWGTPIPSKPAPYLAITEDGLAIRQDGTFVEYDPTMEIVSPRFKQLYQYHRKQPFWSGTPVTDAFLEGKYRQFILLAGNTQTTLLAGMAQRHQTLFCHQV